MGLEREVGRRFVFAGEVGASSGVMGWLSYGQAVGMVGRAWSMIDLARAQDLRCIRTE